MICALIEINSETVTEGKIQALSNKLKGMLDDYKDFRIKHISGDLTKIKEPFKSYIKNVDVRLHDYLVNIARDINYTFEARIQLHIDQDGVVSETRVSTTTLKDKDQARLRDWLRKSGPYEKFPPEIISKNYVGIILTRVVKCVR